MLIQLARAQLPGPNLVKVAGPGPLEPPESAANNVISAPTPPSKNDLPHPPEADRTEAQAGDEDDDEEPPARLAPNDPSDPYSNLDSAFGNYLVDQPRPMANGRNADIDDLLF